MKINLFSTLVGYKRTNYIQLQVRLQLGTMGIKIIFDSSTKDVRSNLIGYSSIGSYRLSLLNSTSLPLVIICADFILEVPGTL